MSIFFCYYKVLGGAIYLHSNKTVNTRRLKLINDCVVVNAKLGSIVRRMLEAEQVNRINAEELNEIMKSTIKNNSVQESRNSVIPKNTNVLPTDSSLENKLPVVNSTGATASPPTNSNRLIVDNTEKYYEKVSGSSIKLFFL